MRTARCSLIVAILSAVFAAGCGGGKEVESVEFKKTDTSPFKGMQDQMTKDLKADKSGKPLTR